MSSRSSLMLLSVNGTAQTLRRHSEISTSVVPVVAYRKRRTSCGQPQATAIFPAHSRAASSSATSTTAKPPRCSLLSTYGPSVNRGVPLDASALNTGAASSSPPVKMRTPAAFISVLSALTALDVARKSSSVRSGTHSSLKAMRYSVMSPPFPGLTPAATLYLLYERQQPDPTPRQEGSEVAPGAGNRSPG